MGSNLTAGLRIVGAVAERADPTAPVSVGSLAESLGLSLSAVSRLCLELEGVRLLERCGHGSYRLGEGAIRLSGMAASPYSRAIRFALTLAAQQTGETVCLAAPSADAMTIVAAVSSVWTLFSPAELGETVDDPRQAIVLVAAAHGESGDGVPRIVESTVGQSVEVATPVLDAAGDCVAVLAVRLPLHRAKAGLARARRALRTARRSLELAVAENRPRQASRETVAEDGSDRALAAAIRLLAHLATGPDSVAGAARAVGLRSDRTARLLESCRRAGVVRFAADRSAAEVAWSVHGWYRAAVAPTIVGRGTRLVAESADRTGACTYITVLRGMRSFTLVEELENAGAGLRMAPWLGRPHPIIGSDGGAVLTSEFDAEQLAALMPSRHTELEVAELQSRVARVLRRGVLTVVSVEEAGQTSISAPVLDSSGGVAAAACIVGATVFMRPRVRELERAAIALARQVSSLLS